MGNKNRKLASKLLVIYVITLLVVQPAFPAVSTISKLFSMETGAEEIVSYTEELDTEDEIVSEVNEQETLPVETVVEESTTTNAEIPTWTTSNEGKDAITTQNVVLGQTYIAPQNSAVTVTFTKLPVEAGLLSIKEIVLTANEVAATKALSNIAYDITANMPEGSYEYDLTLPKPESLDSEFEVKFAESRNDLASPETITQVTKVEANNVVVEDLNHFTIFILTDAADITYTDPSNWNGNYNQGYEGSSVHHYDPNPGVGNSATWNFPDVTGTYYVYVSWSTHTNRTQHAPYTLNYSGGTYSFEINQELLADQVTTGSAGQWSGWYRVGATPFSLNNSSTLVLATVDNSDDTNHVIADEVLLIPDTVPIVNALRTNDTTPEISGTISIDDSPRTVTVSVNSNSYNVTADASGNWILVNDTISPALLEGIYDIEVTYTNMGGSVINDVTINELTIDLTGPVIPGNPGWGQSTPTAGYLGDGVGITKFKTCGSYIKNDGSYRGLWGEASDPAGILRYERQVRGAVTYNGNESTNYTSTFIPGISGGANDGNYYVRIRAIDSLGNSSIDNATWSNTSNFLTWCKLTIDTIAPSAPVVTLTDPINLSNYTSVSITGTAESSSTLNYTISDGVNNITGTGSVDGAGNFNISGINVSSLADGTLSLTATVTDLAGNTGVDSVIYTTTKDTVLPTVGTVSVTNNYNPYVRGNNFTVRMNASDLSGISNCEYTLNYADAEPTWNVGTYDGTRCETGSLSASDGDTLEINMRAFDQVGNVKTGAYIVRISDVYIPIVDSLTISPDVLGHTSSNPTLIAQISDTVSPINRCQYQYRVNTGVWSAWALGAWSPSTDPRTGTCSVPLTGFDNHDIVNFRVRGRDSTNRNSSNMTITKTIDATIPATSLTSPTSSSIWNSAIQLTGQSIDNLGISKVEIYYSTTNANEWNLITKIDNELINTPFNWSSAWTPLVEGVYDIKAYAIDAVGNIENTAYSLGVIYDVTAPNSPVNISPLSADYKNTTGLVLDWSDESDPNGPVTYYYESFWGVSGHYGPVATGYNSFINAPGTPDNIYNWHAKACDRVGNCSDWGELSKLTVDSTFPILSVTDNVDLGPTQSDTITFKVSDTNKNDSTLGFALTSDKLVCNQSLTFSLGNTATFADESNNGKYICFRGSDLAGNTSYLVSSNPLNIDRTAPTTTVSIQGDLDETKNIPNANGWHGQGWYETYDNVNVQIATGDSVNDFINYQVLSGDVSCPIANDSSYALSVSHNTNLNFEVNGTDGVYTLCYYGEDFAGNFETTVHKQILKIDNSIPSYTLKEMNGNLVNDVYYIKSSDVSLKVDVSDEFSGYTRGRFDLYNADSNHVCTTKIDTNQDNDLPAELSTTRTLTKAGLADGNYCFRVWVYDDVQNKSWFPTNGDGWIKFVVDTVSPIFDLQNITLNEGDEIPEIYEFIKENPEELELICTPSVITENNMIVESYNSSKETLISCSGTDLAGNTTTHETKLIVNNVSPTVQITTTPGDFTNELSITMSANISANVSAGNQIASYLWSEGNFANCAGTGTSVITPATPGSYTCKLTVTDIDGDSATALKTVAVTENNPTVYLYSNEDTLPFDGIINVGAGTNFTVIASVVNGDAPFTYAFREICQGTNSVSNTMNLTVGSYSCYVTVTDSNGDIAYASVPIVVSGGIGAGQVAGADDNASNEESTSPTSYPSNNTNSVKGEQTCSKTQNLSGTVFVDENDNDKRDENEKGTENVEITIYDEDNEKVATTKTNSEGKWEVKLCPGDYRSEISKNTLPKDTKVKDESTITSVVYSDLDTENVDFVLAEDKDFAFVWWWILVILIPVIGLGVVYYFIEKQKRIN
jgi:hypothetical protein